MEKIEKGLSEEEAFAAKLNEDRLAGIQRTPEEETALIIGQVSDEYNVWRMISFQERKNILFSLYCIGWLIKCS